MINRIDTFLGRRRNRLITAVLLNVAAMALMYLTTIPVFETNDDSALMDIVNGTRGQMDAHMAFINIGIGLILRTLYTLTANVSWYPVLEAFTMCLGFTAITYILMERSPDTFGFSLALIIVSFHAYTCYSSIQFTKVAAVGCCAGIFTALHAMDAERPRTGLLLGGTVIASLGCMWRFKEFYICAALMSAIGIYMLLSLRGKDKTTVRRKLITYVVSVALMIGIPTALTLWDYHIYQTNVEWHAFQEYNDARSDLFDYGFPTYDDHEAEYNALDINKNAYKLYRSWNYYDPDKCSLETLQAISAMKEPKHFSFSMILSFLGNVPSRFFEYRTFYCMVIFIALWLVWGKKRRSLLIPLIYEGLVFFAIYFLMYFQGRYLLDRVDMGLWLAIALFFAWVLTSDAAEKSGNGAYALLAALLTMTMCVQHWQGGWKWNNYDRITSREGNRNMLHMISADKEHLYIGKNGLIGPYISYGPFDPRPVGELDNRAFFGGWACNTPVMLSNMARYGVTNPFRDCINNEKVYLLDHEIDTTMEYIHDYYDKNAEAVLIKKIGSAGVYSIISG